MQNLTNRADVYLLASRMRMRVYHFHSGSYPCDARMSAYPVNRLFLVTENPDPKENFISDANGRVALEPGCLYLVPAMHMSTWNLTAGLRFISIHFTLNDLSTIDVFSLAGRIFTLRDEALRDGIYSAWNEPDCYAAAAKLKIAVYRVCAELFRRYPEAKFDASEKFHAILDTINYIDTSASAQTTVGELAERSGMRPDVFSRHFAAAAGVPPKVWLNRVITRKAGELLMHGVSSREAAARLGFNNEFYFSRFFKTHIGIAPREFRERYRFSGVPERGE